MDFLGEQTFSTNLAETTVLHVIACGTNGMLFEHIKAAQHRAKRGEKVHEQLRLLPGERRCAGTDPQRPTTLVQPQPWTIQGWGGDAVTKGRGGVHVRVLLLHTSQEKMGKVLMRPVLGIESSCDETAAAVLDHEGRVLAEIVASQEAAHSPYGGVVPEIAARAHLALLPNIVKAVMRTARLQFSELGGVAASAGPGLIGGLTVGSQMAKGIALAQRLPYVAVNHLEAHALIARLPGQIVGSVAFPYLLLLVSGGHCQCVAVEGVGQHIRLGGTVDDAAGEAFDKVAKLLGLGWPGGPPLERLAAQGDPSRYPFPRPMLGRQGCDFSFSGLKTAVAQEVALHRAGALPTSVAADIAASFQCAVADVLADRATHAIAMMRSRAHKKPTSHRMDLIHEVDPNSDGRTADTPQARLLVVAGGVAANGAVRAALRKAAAAAGFTLLAPPIRLCTDNAVMVAWTGVERLRLGLIDRLDFAPRPRWPLEGPEMTS